MVGTGEVNIGYFSMGFISECYFLFLKKYFKNQSANFLKSGTFFLSTLMYQKRKFSSLKSKKKIV